MPTDRVGNFLEPEIITTDIVPPVAVTPQPKKNIWGGWATFGLGVIIFAVYFAAQTAVAVFYAFSWLFTHEGDIDINSIMELATNGDLISVATIISGIFGIGFIILFIKIRKGAGFREYLGLNAFSAKKFFITFAVIITLFFLLSYGLQFLNVPDDDAFTLDAYRTVTWLPLLWIAVAIFAPAFEESFFRGFLFVGFLNSRLGAVGAVALTAIAWALLHIQYSVFGIVTIFILGVALGIIRLKTKSLWITIILHSLWNIAALVATALSV